MADLTVASVIDNFMSAATGDDACNAIGAAKASETGTIAALTAPAMADLAATTAVPSGPAPFQYNYYKDLTGDLSLTEGTSPAEGNGHTITFFADGTTRTITIPTSYSTARGANITTFKVPASGVVRITRQYINGAWRIFGDPALQYKELHIAFDPKAVCDGAVDRLFLMKVPACYPDGIIIDEWHLTFEADPTTEADLDLKRADAFIGVANSAVMDVLDTTAGTSSESTAANINSGSAIATSKVIYLEFGTAYTETTHQVYFRMTYHPVVA